MKYLKTYRLFESMDEESLSEVRDYVHSMMVDMEDYEYGFLVNSSTQTMIPSNGIKKEIIDVNIWKKNADSIDIELLQDRIGQVGEIIKPYELKEFRIRPGFNFRVSMPKSIYFDSLEDYNIKQILDDSLKVDKFNVTLDEEGMDYKKVDDEQVSQIEFWVKDWGMDEWMKEMKFVGRSEKNGKYKYNFESTMQFDDFDTFVDDVDIEEDVRMVINDVNIQYVKVINL